MTEEGGKRGRKRKEEREDNIDRGKERGGKKKEREWGLEEGREKGRLSHGYRQYLGGTTYIKKNERYKKTLCLVSFVEGGKDRL